MLTDRCHAFVYSVLSGNMDKATHFSCYFIHDLSFETKHEVITSLLHIPKTQS